MNSNHARQVQSKIEPRLVRFGIDILPMGNGEILSEQVLYQNGSYKRIRRWISGIHPHRGVITRGYTGFETIEELDIITATHKFTVLPEIKEIQTA